MKRRKPRGESDLNEPGFGVAIGRGGFVIEEAREKVAHELRELAALRDCARVAESCLRAQRLHCGSGHQEKGAGRHQPWLAA